MDLSPGADECGLGAPYHRIRRLTISLLLAAAAAIAAPVASALPKVASISTCADQVLIAIAEPEQIVGLSAFATDPGISFYAERAAEFRILGTSAEELLKLRPDLVFASLYIAPDMKERLERTGIEVVTLGFTDSIEAALDQTRRIAVLVGQRQEGERLIGRIEAALDAVDPAENSAISALQLQRRGFTSGTQTLLADLLARFGVESAAGKLGVQDIGRVDLERLLKLRPDVLVMDTLDPDVPDQGSALLSHPALVAAYPPARRIVLPSREIVCGGPSLLAAIETLSRQLGRIRGGPVE